MRAWKMTAGLAVAALLAAVVAPRLLGRVELGQSGTVSAPSGPVVVEVPSRGQVAPARIEAIPELSVPIAVPQVPTAVPEAPIQPDPTLEEHWLEMVDCGMG